MIKFSIGLILISLISFHLKSQTVCKDLENSFYSITNIVPTGNYKNDVKEWIISEAFASYLSKQDSLFRMVVPIVELDTEIILTRNSKGDLIFLKNRFANIDAKFFNHGFANFIVSQIADPITIKKWQHCKKTKLCLNAFAFDTTADAFHLHLNSRSSSGGSIKIETPILINAVYDSTLYDKPRFPNGAEIYSGGPSGGIEIICRKKNLLKSTLILVNPIDDYDGIFIYLPPAYANAFSSTYYLNGDFFIQQSHQRLTSCGLKEFIRNDEEVKSTGANTASFPPKLTEWTPEEIDCYIISNYLYEKGLVLKNIKNIIEDPSPLVRNKLPSYQKTLKNIENKFLKKIYIVKDYWHRQYPLKVNSY